MNAFYASMMRLDEATTEEREGVQLRQLRRLVLVDEADEFMRLKLPSLRLTMQMGRSFGCGVILSTQFLSHFSGNDAPLRQLVGTWLMHQMAEVKPKEVEGLFGVTNKEAVKTTQRLAKLEKHRSYAIGLSAKELRRDPTVIRDQPFFELIQGQEEIS